MKNKAKSTLLIVLFTSLILLAAYISHIITLKATIGKQVTAGDDRGACNDTNLTIEKLPVYLRNNDYAINLLRKECSYVTDSFQQDVNNDGDDEIFMQTTSLFCGRASCKDRAIYILGADNELFYANGYDIHFEKATKPRQFNVVEQIRHWNDPPCCSSQDLIITYEYSAQDELQFKSISTVIR